MSRKPWIADPRTGVIVGLVLFIGGALVLHDVYGRRGRDTPLWLRPFTFL